MRRTDHEASCERPDAGQPGLQLVREGHGITPAEDGPTQKAGIGLGIVRVYNPYMNREEVFDWDTFAAAYAITTESTVANISVVAPSSNQSN